MDEKIKDDLIKYRIEQAENSIKTVKLLIDNLEYSSAVNRIYYGMFYILLAVALKNGFETSKHNILIGWFNQNFIKTDFFPKRYGKIIHQIFKKRLEGDYDAFIKFEKNEIDLMFEDMKDFIKVLSEYLTNKNK